MVRGEAHAQPKHAPRAKVRRSSKTAEVGGEKGAKMSIVRAQIRLPKELSEKMPSAPTTPVPIKKKTMGNEKMTVKKQPLTVASMVRRFELESGADTKTRAGYKNDGFGSRGGSGISTPRPSTPVDQMAPVELLAAMDLLETSQDAGLQGRRTPPGLQDAGQQGRRTPPGHQDAGLQGRRTPPGDQDAGPQGTRTPPGLQDAGPQGTRTPPGLQDQVTTPLSSRASSLSDTRSPRESGDTKALQEDTDTTDNLTGGDPQAVGTGAKRGKEPAGKSFPVGGRNDEDGHVVKTGNADGGGIPESKNKPDSNRPKSAKKPTTTEALKGRGLAPQAKSSVTVAHVLPCVARSAPRPAPAAKIRPHHGGTSQPGPKPQAQTGKHSSINASRTASGPGAHDGSGQSSALNKSGPGTPGDKRTSDINKLTGHAQANSARSAGPQKLIASPAGVKIKKKSVDKKQTSEDKKEGLAEEEEKKECGMKQAADKKHSHISKTQMKSNDNGGTKTMSGHVDFHQVNEPGKKNVTEKNMSLSKKNVKQSPLEKAGASVSSVRKNFEKKVENTEGGGEGKTGQRKRLAGITPKVKIGQKISVKGRGREEEHEFGCTKPVMDSQVTICETPGQSSSLEEQQNNSSISEPSSLSEITPTIQIPSAEQIPTPQILPTTEPLPSIEIDPMREMTPSITTTNSNNTPELASLRARRASRQSRHDSTPVTRHASRSPARDLVLFPSMSDQVVHRMSTHESPHRDHLNVPMKVHPALHLTPDVQKSMDNLSTRVHTSSDSSDVSPVPSPGPESPRIDIEDHNDNTSTRPCSPDVASPLPGDPETSSSLRPCSPEICSPHADSPEHSSSPHPSCSNTDRESGTDCHLSSDPVRSLSRVHTIPRLNMDDSEAGSIPMDVCDRLPVGSSDRLGSAQLEHDLPESPAYRSPLLSDSEPDDTGPTRHHVIENFSSNAESLKNRLLNNLVKRSESDGIVCMEGRPRPEAQVRRCESIDDAMDLVNKSHNLLEPVTFPQSIKTVTPATIMKGPEDYTAGVQETVYLRAHYFGNPEPRVAWFKGGRRLSHADRIKIRTYPGESTLVIKNLRADDSGKYEIQIENEVGCDATSASLCCEGPPEPPGGRPYITTIDRDALRLTLAWYGSTFDGGSMLTGYIVEMSSWPITTDSDPPQYTDWTVVTSKCHSTSYIVKGLDMDREYIFRVKAQNIHGPSDPGKVSEPVSFIKSEDDLDDLDEFDESDDDEDFEAPFEHRPVALDDGAIFKDKFEIYEELGRGRFGVVFKVKDKDTREIFAAKFVRCRKQEERQKCKEEINIMNGLDHNKLLQLAAAYENQREVIMIMEYIGGGELFEKVVADDFTLTERDCVLFMRQICSAIGYMHQANIVHLDLKPENILCKSKRSHQIKIIDFGLTRRIHPGEDVRILFGTPEFVSPEVISYEPVSIASDMWSVGVVCYVLLSGLSPFMGEADVETFANITGMCYDFEDEAFDLISEDAKDFILKLLVKDQRKRMKALECLKHPWLTQKENEKEGIYKEINTDKLKSFLMRRRWQKAAHAIRALGRFTSLGFRQDSKDSASSITALSTQSADF